jgi:hypothetical protein
LTSCAPHPCVNIFKITAASQKHWWICRCLSHHATCLPPCMPQVATNILGIVTVPFVEHMSCNSVSPGCSSHPCTGCHIQIVAHNPHIRLCLLPA